MTRDTYLKQKQWEPVEIGNHEWMILWILTVSFLAIKSAIVKFCDLRTSLTTGTCDQNNLDDSCQGIWKYSNRSCWWWSLKAKVDCKESWCHDSNPVSNELLSPSFGVLEENYNLPEFQQNVGPCCSRRKKGSLVLLRFVVFKSDDDSYTVQYEAFSSSNKI